MAELVGEELERKRGDTAPDVITVVDENGAARDITGFSYRLTINTAKRPIAGSVGTEIMTTNGVITDAAGGEVSFPWSAVQADQAPAKYWYDIEQTDAAGLIKTIAKNSYTFYQDISK